MSFSRNGSNDYADSYSEPLTPTVSDDESKHSINSFGSDDELDAASSVGSSFDSREGSTDEQFYEPNLPWDKFLAWGRWESKIIDTGSRLGSWLAAGFSSGTWLVFMAGFWIANHLVQTNVEYSNLDALDDDFQKDIKEQQYDLDLFFWNFSWYLVASMLIFFLARSCREWVNWSQERKTENTLNYINQRKAEVQLEDIVEDNDQMALTTASNTWRELTIQTVTSPSTYTNLSTTIAILGTVTYFISTYDAFDPDRSQSGFDYYTFKACAAEAWKGKLFSSCMPLLVWCTMVGFTFLIARLFQKLKQNQTFKDLYTATQRALYRDPESQTYDIKRRLDDESNALNQNHTLNMAQPLLHISNADHTQNMAEAPLYRINNTTENHWPSFEEVLDKIEKKWQSNNAKPATLWFSSAFIPLATGTATILILFWLHKQNDFNLAKSDAKAAGFPNDQAVIGKYLFQNNWDSLSEHSTTILTSSFFVLLGLILSDIADHKENVNIRYFEEFFSGNHNSRLKDLLHNHIEETKLTYCEYIQQNPGISAYLGILLTATYTIGWWVLATFYDVMANTNDAADQFEASNTFYYRIYNSLGYMAFLMCVSALSFLIIEGFEKHRREELLESTQALLKQKGNNIEPLNYEKKEEDEDSSTYVSPVIPQLLSKEEYDNKLPLVETGSIEPDQSLLANLNVTGNFINTYTPYATSFIASITGPVDVFYNRELHGGSDPTYTPRFSINTQTIETEYRNLRNVICPNGINPDTSDYIVRQSHLIAIMNSAISELIGLNIITQEMAPYSASFETPDEKIAWILSTLASAEVAFNQASLDDDSNSDEKEMKKGNALRKPRPTEEKQEEEEDPFEGKLLSLQTFQKTTRFTDHTQHSLLTGDGLLQHESFIAAINNALCYKTSNSEHATPEALHAELREKYTDLLNANDWQASTLLTNIVHMCKIDIENNTPESIINAIVKIYADRLYTSHFIEDYTSIKQDILNAINSLSLHEFIDAYQLLEDQILTSRAEANKSHFDGVMNTAIQALIRCLNSLYGIPNYIKRPEPDAGKFEWIADRIAEALNFQSAKENFDQLSSNIVSAIKNGTLIDCEAASYGLGNLFRDVPDDTLQATLLNSLINNMRTKISIEYSRAIPLDEIDLRNTTCDEKYEWIINSIETFNSCLPSIKYKTLNSSMTALLEQTAPEADDQLTRIRSQFQDLRETLQRDEVLIMDDVNKLIDNANNYFSHHYNIHIDVPEEEMANARFESLLGAIVDLKSMITSFEEDFTALDTYISQTLNNDGRFLDKVRTQLAALTTILNHDRYLDDHMHTLLNGLIAQYGFTAEAVDLNSLSAEEKCAFILNQLETQLQSTLTKREEKGAEEDFDEENGLLGKTGMFSHQQNGGSNPSTPSRRTTRDVTENLGLIISQFQAGHRHEQTKILIKQIKGIIDPEYTNYINIPSEDAISQGLNKSKNNDAEINHETLFRAYKRLRNQSIDKPDELQNTLNEIKKALNPFLGNATYDTLPSDFIEEYTHAIEVSKRKFEENQNKVRTQEDANTEEFKDQNDLLKESDEIFAIIYHELKQRDPSATEHQRYQQNTIRPNFG